MTRTNLLALMLGVLAPLLTRAHLCNDVFVQAKDNLAVKVDIRDGQLRISKKASFRVYLLNTMDRGIANINLEIKSKEFTAIVKPGPGWRRFPSLGTSKKVYFNVTLTRKPGIPDGKYKIGLRLFNGQRRSMEFKTVDLTAAAATHRLAARSRVTVDGQAKRNEWGKALICSDFYDYVKAGKYFVNQRAADQSRFRVMADRNYVYCLLGFLGGEDAEADVATIYASGGPDATPVSIKIDRLSGKAESAAGTKGVIIKKVRKSQMLECRIPRKLLGIAEGNEFYLNFTRTIRRKGKEKMSYWRGNKLSLTNPMIYDRFILAR